MNETKQDTSTTDSITDSVMDQFDEYVPKDKFRIHPKNPLTPSETDWVFRQREYNGFADAFVKVNARKFIVHVPTIIRRLSERRGA